MALLVLSGCASLKPTKPKEATDPARFQANVTAEGVPVAPPVQAEVATDVDGVDRSPADEGPDAPSHRKKRRRHRHRHSSCCCRDYDDDYDDDSDDEDDGYDERPRHKEPRKKERGPASVASKPAKPKIKGGKMVYVVQQGDTLMKIAFKVFGDVFRWREIYQDNRSKVNNPTFLVKGTELNLRAGGFATITRNGLPYLIRWRDTLGTISDGIYGTTTKWPKLWHNNPELIHDPNKIYAGFNLYYVITEEEKKEAEKLRVTRRRPAGQKGSPGSH